jgi:hypothetical protein
MLASAFVARWRAGSKVETAAVCFMCQRTSRRRGLGRGCIGRRELNAPKRSDRSTGRSAAVRRN